MTTLLLSVSLLLSIRFIDAAYITHPVSLNTTLNSTVNFTCEATGSIINFFVNSEPAGDQSIKKNGFDELTQVTFNGTIRRRKLSVHAREMNNNTNIYCSTDGVKSNNATLRIQGLLDSVSELDWNLINGSSVFLSWRAPYTLDNVPITGYNINNNINTTNTSRKLLATDPDVCNMTTITVSAINDVGIGQTNSVSFYYERVPTHTPYTSVSASLVEAKLSLNTTINVSGFCIGEYPNNITIIVLDTTNVIHDSFHVSPQVDDQLIMSLVTLSTNLTIFLVNVSMRNNGGEFNNVSSFIFGILGPVTNIRSSINGCSSISVTWDDPVVVDDRLRPAYYNLIVYDNVTGSPMNIFKANNNSYQFEDEDLFNHRYMYVITGVNELGEGISNNKTFSYQRVPGSVLENSTFYILNYTLYNISIGYKIPVTLECIGESLENATVTVHCDKECYFSTIYLVEYTNQPINLNETITVPRHKHCSLSIVFSNDAGSSEPFILSLYPQVCSQSDVVGNIPDLRTCTGTPAVGSAIYRPPFNLSTSNCSSIADDHHISVFHQDIILKAIIHPPPERYNDTACLVHFTLSDDDVSENINTLFQVLIIPIAQSDIFYCSNNFTLLVDTAPPDQIVPDVTVNCTGVSIYWSTPYYPPGCPLKYYEMKFNNEIMYFNIGNMSYYYSLSNLSLDTSYTVSISAVSDAGISMESDVTFITAISPVVIMASYRLFSLENTTLIVDTKVDNVDCPFSYPSYVQYSITCGDGYVKNYIYSVSVNTTDGSIIQYQELFLSLGLCNCTAVITWYNRVNNSQECINFGTTPLVNVSLDVSRCETLTVKCSYPLPLSPSFTPDSPLLGCGVTLSNSTATINKVVFIHNNNDNWLVLPVGLYTILSFACYNEECTNNVSVCLDYDRMITISKCHSNVTASTSVSLSPGNNNVIFIASGTVLITFITITVPLFIFLFYKWKKAAYRNHSEDKDSKVEYASNNTGKMLIPAMCISDDVANRTTSTPKMFESEQRNLTVTSDSTTANSEVPLLPEHSPVQANGEFSFYTEGKQVSTCVCSTDM